MYKICFNETQLSDLLAYNSPSQGRQFYSAILVPDSGVFTDRVYDGSSIDLPDIVCPYVVNDILAVQEWWARDTYSYTYRIDASNPNLLANRFRPPTTMPISAARMYIRITSIRTWRIIDDTYNNYLVKGSNPNSYAATTKYVGNYDPGNSQMHAIRKRKNDAILSKLKQPSIPVTTSGETISPDIPKMTISVHAVDSSGNPIVDGEGHYVMIPTEVVSNQYKVFTWLISGYLCDAEGNIYGNYFGVKE